MHALLLSCLCAPQDPLRFQPTIGEEVRVTLELEWELEVVGTGDEDLVLFAHSLRSILDDMGIALEGERELVWRDRWSAPNVLHRTFEHMAGTDTLEIDWQLPWIHGFDQVEVELGSPLEGLTAEVHRVDGRWVPSFSDELTEEELARLDRLTWDTGLESLLPSGPFLYTGGEECRALLRPLGWQPWDAIEHQVAGVSGVSMFEAWTISPLARPRLDDPRLVLRRTGESDDNVEFAIRIEVVEEIDLGEEVDDAELDLEGLAVYFEPGRETVFQLHALGDGSLTWSKTLHRPIEVSLDLEVKLQAELIGGAWGWSLPLSVLTEGRFRQLMKWESVDSDRDS